MAEGVKCKCGLLPDLHQESGDNGSNFNGVQFKIICTHCGDKHAPWRKSRLIAVSEWENIYFKI
jgi:hypothetical protein